MKKIMVYFTIIMLNMASFSTPLFALENKTDSGQAERLSAIESNSLVDDITILKPTVRLSNNTLQDEQNISPIESSRSLKISEFMLKDSSCDLKECAQIEIYNESDEDFFLTEWKIKYLSATSSSTKELVVSIPEMGSYEYLTFDVSVTGTANGYLQIVDNNGAQVDIVGYGSNAKTNAKGSSPTKSPPDKNSLQRCELPDRLLINTNKNSTDFAEYPEPSWGTGIPCEEGGDEEVEYVMCEFLSLNEISFSDPKKFIEIVNTTSKTIDLSDCALRRGNKYINMTGNLAPGKIKSFDVQNTELTQTNGSVNIHIYDILQKKNVATVYYKAKNKTSFAWLKVDGKESWYSTYAMTPGKKNVYQKFQTCEAGKHINEATGNCVKDPKPPAECKADQYRNPETGRCKKIDSGTTLKPCRADQYRNPETGRCKKIASDSGLKPCKEGWERNPETNRCRKIPVGGEATHAVGPMTDENENRTWVLIGAIGAAAIAGLIIWQFHPEIKRFFERIYAKIKR